MRKILFLLLCSVITFTAFSQELNCNIVVNATQTGNENFPVFKTLEKQLREFVNNTKWTNKTVASRERIDCNMYINVTSYSGNFFTASIQVQSSRPVYGSTYTTPVYNINDKDFNFTYLEFQNLVYNPNQFQSNLISVIAFHINMVLGLDADTFELNGGEAYFSQAQTIVNYSQQNDTKGWKLEDGLQSRFALIDNILSPTFKEFRTVMYDYHRKGLDQMSDNVKTAKENIGESLSLLKAMNDKRPNSFLLRTFFDAKADEIEQIFTDGPSVNISNLVSTLNRVAPMHSSKWRNIKF